MKQASLGNGDWQVIVDRLGGAEAIAASAREAKAFLRPRAIGSALDLLRLVLAYCLGHQGLRSTAAWAGAVGLGQLSNVALLHRLRRSGDWLAVLVGRALAAAAPPAGRGRMIRLVDATTVPQAGAAGRQRNHVWRLHSGFDLPAERFSCFELTDHKSGERLDRLAVSKGEIRIADRAYMQPERIRAVLHAGGDVVIRAGWRARWRDADGRPVDLISEFRRNAERGQIDRPIWVQCRESSACPTATSSSCQPSDPGPSDPGPSNPGPSDPGPTKGALALRLVAVKKPPAAAETARRHARRQAQKGGHQITAGTLEAAGWVTLVTSLPAETFSTADILALYRLRWRIELAFKRLKSVVGLKGPPAVDPRSARPWLLAHLLLILLLEPLVDELEDSPRSAAA